MRDINLGYTKKLCILPFDHRSYFKELFEYHEPLSIAQNNELTEYKKIIYAGYEQSLTMGVSKSESGILVDDVFGLDILLDAKNKGYIILQSIEVSGVDYFEFEHEDWQTWIEKVKPIFTKALVRYNPEGDAILNEKSLVGLRTLSNYSHEHGYKFLIEALVPPTEEQSKSTSGDKSRYDHDLRPDLTVRMIEEMQNADIEPDIWKIEGMYTEADYEKQVMVAHRDNRNNVGIISLGRNEPDSVVETWLRIGSKVPGVTGFAVGRTVFLNALLKYRSGEYTQEQAATEVAERFLHFYNTFNT